MHPEDVSTASNETILREILDVMTALRDGHFTTHLPDDLPGLGGQVAAVLNAHLEMLATFRREHHRLLEEIGVTGRLGGQMEVEGAAGAWKKRVDEVNRTGFNLTARFRDGGNVVRSLVRGDLSARTTRGHPGRVPPVPRGAERVGLVVRGTREPQRLGGRAQAVG